MIDRHKPRYRKDKGLKIKLVSHEFFNLYREKFPKSKIDSYTKMRSVLKCFHEHVTDIVSTSRQGFDLMNLAYIITVGYLPTDEYRNKETRFINYKLSNEHDKKIKYLNLETDGRYCKIFFSMDLPRYKFKYKKAWAFTPCRTFKAKVSKEFRANFNKFILMEHGEPYRNIFNSLL